MSAPIIDIDENLRLARYCSRRNSFGGSGYVKILQIGSPDVVAVELCKSRHSALTSRPPTRQRRPAEGNQGRKSSYGPIAVTSSRRTT